MARETEPAGSRFLKALTSSLCALAEAASAPLLLLVCERHVAAGLTAPSREVPQRRTTSRALSHYADEESDGRTGGLHGRN
jgi:hypothetical protein